MADDGPDLDDEAIDSLEAEANEKAGVTAEQTKVDDGAETAGDDAVEPRTASEAEALLDEAEADLKRALDDEPAPVADKSPTTPFEFSSLEGPSKGAAPVLPIESLHDVELDLRIELGRTELLVDDVMKLAEGSVVQLDKLAGDPVDVRVNGRLIARGEVLVLNDNFCVRVVEIVTPDL